MSLQKKRAKQQLITHAFQHMQALVGRPTHSVNCRYKIPTNTYTGCKEDGAPGLLGDVAHLGLQRGHGVTHKAAVQPNALPTDLA